MARKIIATVKGPVREEEEARELVVELEDILLIDC